jgi:phospholipid/cholesterol/gamma-HCH transport system ATP-binding protein
VVLKDISFTLIKGHTKIILGASGSGKSTILKIITGAAALGRGRRLGQRDRGSDQLSELEMMAVRPISA